ncbi:hypothetical protein EYF80_027794 [Liparis tanakae]|uniref:Uncharacterized protein n=1 Tax=Liparis tanakae TaxID=230148 RepID=A0A4Z2H818_9TELE|nr:hypothetical protein EYF80_027794 [Liparis tanakae]
MKNGVNAHMKGPEGEVLITSDNRSEGKRSGPDGRLLADPRLLFPPNVLRFAEQLHPIPSIRLPRSSCYARRSQTVY